VEVYLVSKKYFPLKTSSVILLLIFFVGSSTSSTPTSHLHMIWKFDADGFVDRGRDITDMVELRPGLRIMLNDLALISQQLLMVFLKSGYIIISQLRVGS